MFIARPQNPAAAVALILLASALMAVTTLIAKALGTGALGPALHPMQISFGRFIFALLLVAFVCAATRQEIGAIHWRLHIGRTSFGWMGVTLMFAAVSFIPLSDATAITFLNPVFAMLLAIPLLGERIGPVRWVAAGIALIGALILLRPTPASFQPAALLALTAAFVIGFELIFIKKLSGREAPLQILLINNLMGACIAVFAVQWVWQSPLPAQWGALALIGVLMACAQLAFVNGMARADASFVAPISYSTLVFATLYDFLVFHAVPDAVSIAGALIILSGGVLLAVREARARERGGGNATTPASRGEDAL